MSVYIPGDSKLALAYREPSLLVPNAKPLGQVKALCPGNLFVANVAKLKDIGSVSPKLGQAGSSWVYEKGGVNVNASSGRYLQFGSARSIGSELTMIVDIAGGSRAGNNPGLWRSGSSSVGGDFFIVQGGSDRPWIRVNSANVLFPASGDTLALSGVVAYSVKLGSSGTAVVAQCAEGSIRSWAATHSQSAWGTAEIHNIGYQNDTSEYWAGSYRSLAILDKAYSETELRRIVKDYYAFVVRPANDAPFLIPTTGGGAFSLTAESGTFSATGSDAGLKADRKIVPESGGFTLTGQAAALNKGARIVVEAGSYILTGTAASLIRDASLSAESGSFTLTGTDAGLQRDYTLSAASGTFALTGSDATLTYTPVSGAYSLVAESGSFTLTGTAAGLVADRTLSVDAGSYSLTGSDVTLQRGYVLDIGAGAFSLTGSDVSFGRTYTLSIDAGAFVLTGADAGLDYAGAVWTPIAEASTSWADISTSTNTWTEI